MLNTEKLEVGSVCFSDTKTLCHSQKAQSGNAGRDRPQGPPGLAKTRQTSMQHHGTISKRNSNTPVLVGGDKMEGPRGHAVAKGESHIQVMPE